MPGPAIDISIVVATCSRAELLCGALQSVLQQCPQEPPAQQSCQERTRPERIRPEQAFLVELIVVDDGSIDHTQAVLAQLQRDSAVPITILSGSRKGVAAARNLAAANARGTWLASFDDDQIALPGWLEALSSAAEQTGAACVGGALLLQLPSGHTPAEFGPRVRAILGEHAPGGALPDRAAPYPPGIRPATNNVLIRRALFEQLGGYDTSFTEGAEDADFFDRVASAGHTLYFQPAAQALHLIPPARLEPRSLRWTSLRIGAGDARLEQRRQPFFGPLRRAALRLAVALFRDLPQLAWATLRRNHRARLDVLCSLWYTQGLLRAIPALLLSRSDSPFLRSLNFRARNGERPELSAPDKS